MRNGLEMIAGSSLVPDSRVAWPTYWLGLGLLLSACAVRPPAGPLPDAGQRPAIVRVADESGPLNAAQAAAAVRRIEGEDEYGLLARHLGQVEAVMTTPLALGNNAHLLIDGPQTQRAMLRAIAEARQHVDLETYLLEPAV